MIKGSLESGVTRSEVDDLVSHHGAIQIRGVSKIYGSREREVQALQAISVDIPRSEFVSILGPSGCGKTTLLKIIGDIIEPTTGSVLIDGVPAREIRRQRRFGYVFQAPVLLPWKTVRDNVKLPYKVGSGLDRFSRDEIDRRVELTLTRVGLAEFMDRLPAELSGGMQSRVALARALVYEPGVLLMDEPFASLDELTRTEMAIHLLELWQQFKTTVVFVTHHIEEAVMLSDRILLMSERPGRVRRELVVGIDRPRTLSTRKDQEFRDLVDDLMTEFHSRSGQVS